MKLGRFLLYVLAAVIVAGIAGRIMVELAAPGRVTSWWRSPWRNRELGGHPLSRHQVGLGYDLAPVSGSLKMQLRSLFAWVPTATVVDEGDHIHVQLA